MEFRKSRISLDSMVIFALLQSYRVHVLQECTDAKILKRYLKLLDDDGMKPQMSCEVFGSIKVFNVCFLIFTPNIDEYWWLMHIWGNDPGPVWWKIQFGGDYPPTSVVFKEHFLMFHSHSTCRAEAWFPRNVRELFRGSHQSVQRQTAGGKWRKFKKWSVQNRDYASQLRKAVVIKTKRW